MIRFKVSLMRYQTNRRDSMGCRKSYKPKNKNQKKDLYSPCKHYKNHNIGSERICLVTNQQRLKRRIKLDKNRLILLAMTNFMIGRYKTKTKKVNQQMMSIINNYQDRNN